MTILPLNPTDNASPDALRTFFGHCADVARSTGRPQLASISVAVDSLDPLAVLESIYEERQLHFYVEKPAEGFAVAGAEAVLECKTSGSGRLAEAKAFIAQTLENTIAVGALEEEFAGPHFFVAAGFSPEAAPAAPFPSLRVFVPRWQVSRRGEGSVAVANLPITPDLPLDLVTAKVWKAHQKFRAFDYREAKVRVRPSAPQRIEEVGETGGYQRIVAEALAGIGRGECEKIVLARAQKLTTSESFHPMGALNHLRARYPGCYSFSVANGTGQSFIGATPERLVRVAGGRLHTAALAGSAPRGQSASEDAVNARGLLQSEKDLREHRVVIGSIQRRLADLDVQLDFAASPRILALANVQHLHTPITAALPAGVHLLDLVERLHPTPAVGGTPRAAALAAIRRLEPFDRGLYAGALGWVDHRGGGEFFVGIRSALIDGCTATAYAGAGIVAGSDPQKEFAETELKFKALIEALTQT